MRYCDFSHLQTTDGRELRELKFSGIYIIRNNKDNKSYIGSSYNIYNRLIDHLLVSFDRDNRKRKYKYKIHHAIHKYGVSNFSFDVLATCPPEYNLKLEQWFLDNLKPEYNILKTAGSPRGRKMSKEEIERRKISLKNSIKNNLNYVEEKKEACKKMAITRSGLSIDQIGLVKEMSVKNYTDKEIQIITFIPLNKIRRIINNAILTFIEPSETGVLVSRNFKWYVIDIHTNEYIGYYKQKEILKDCPYIKYENICNSTSNKEYLIKWRYKVCRDIDLEKTLLFVKNRYTKTEIEIFKTYHLNNNGNRKGAKHTEENIIKSKERRVGKRHSEETKQKIKDSQQGVIKKISEESRKSISEKNRVRQKELNLDRNFLLKKSRIIQQFDLDMHLNQEGIISDFKKIGFKSFNIYACLRGCNKTSSGYIWKYKN